MGGGVHGNGQARCHDRGSMPTVAREGSRYTRERRIELPPLYQVSPCTFSSHANNMCVLVSLYVPFS